MEFINFTATCNDNGTSLDPSDDFFEVNFSVANNLAQAGLFDLDETTSGNLGAFQFGENIFRHFEKNSISFLEKGTLWTTEGHVAIQPDHWLLTDHILRELFV